MALDNAKNFAKSTLASGISNSATSLTVATGEGAKFPAVPFNATIWNKTDYFDPADDPNVEIVRVTAISTDTFTVTRGQESTSGVAHNTAGKVYGIIAGLTAKTVNQDVAGADGWTSAQETWTYTSATTITVPTDATTKYQKGDKIKLTQTTVKYFYIVGVSSTVLTITGGSDYTLANAAISANYYSKAENPQGFPDWFNYTPTLTGYSVNPSIELAAFKIAGITCFVKVRAWSGGTSNTTTLAHSLPVAVGTDNSEMPMGRAYDNSGFLTTTAQATWSGSTATFYPNPRGDGWTNTGGKGVIGTYCYRI